MSEDIKREENRQSVSDEELDEVSGGFNVTLLPYDPTKKPTVERLPYKPGKKPEVTLL